VKADEKSDFCNWLAAWQTGRMSKKEISMHPDGREIRLQL